MRALICGPDEDENEKMASSLGEQGMDCFCVDNGKDAQLELHNHKYFALFIDFDTSKNHSFEVVRYSNLNCPSTRVILVIDKLKRLEDDFLLTEKKVLEMGVLEILEKPFSSKQVYDRMMGETKYKVFNKKKKNEVGNIPKESVVKAFDDEFTRIRIEEFFAGKIAIFELYIRLSENRYTKILNKGDSFEQDRIRNYQEEKNVEYLYFKNKDRIIYINMMNDLLNTIKQKGSKAQKAKIRIIKNLGAKFIEETYTSGVTPNLVDEATHLCKHTMDVVMQDKHYCNLLKMIEDYGGDLYSHSTAVMFVASLICYQNDWATNQSVNLVTMGALFHDIGKVKLADSLRLKRPKNMTPKELALYQRHPEFGVDQVEGLKHVPAGVRQIIAQHHELYDGSGFPEGLHGVKVFPLAKMVSLADCIVNMMTEEKLTLVEATKSLIKNKKLRIKYDPQYLFCLKEMTGGEKVYGAY